MTNEKKKIIFTFLSLFFLFSLVAIKAFYVQIYNRDKLIAYSNSQFIRTSKVFPYRGQIYDRNGEPMAINIRLYNIFTIPRRRGGNLTSFKNLSKIVDELSYQKIRKKVKNRDRFTWIARKISLTKKQTERISKIKEIYIEEESSRFYPNHEVASQILGFVGVDNDGLAGIEYQHNEELRGKAKIVKYFRDAKGRPIKYETTEDHKSTELFLSIDKKLQAKAEKFLKEAVDNHAASYGGVGVMDAETGELLAVANYPSFDPNNLRANPSVNRRLSFVSDPFEPGSTFKVFTVASALENKIAKYDSNFYCERGRFKVQDHYITEAESKKEYEWLSVEDIVKYSSNIGTTKIAFDLTFPKLRKTLDKLGIGQKTGIELPGESRGIFVEGDNISPLSLSNISFGQGVATTGVQMLAAFAAIANGGYKIQPTIIRQTKATPREKIFDQSVTDQLTKMMVKAVEEGTGKNARIPLYKIAGKTSTAQRVSKNGGYKGYVAGFIGYPVNTERKYVIYSYVDNPTKGGYYGNTVAAPVFRKITEYLLYKDKSFKALSEDKRAPETYSVDKINITQSSAKRFSGVGKVPNFLGLDKKSAAKLAKSAVVSVVHRGFGVVSTQTLEAGVSVANDTKVILQYAPPSYE